MAFSVKISDSGTYKDNAEKNQKLNHAIDKTLEIIESKGDKFTNDLPIEASTDGGYDFTIAGNTLLRFKRDIYGTKSINELTDEQKQASANEMMTYLCDRYEINANQFSTSHLLEIINLRRYMSANSYNRYITFVIANEVSDETVAAILENSDELIGVTVEEQYIRRYVDSVYCSQILGYTGTVSASELESLQTDDDSYEANDIVGKTGIEKALENELAGEKGSKTVYVDTVGRITEVLDETDSKAGNDVYLTIDVNLQKKIYNAIEDEIVQLLLKYFVPEGSSKYVMESGNSTATVYIPMNEAYFALIDNNIVSMDEIASEKTANEQNIYNAFLSKKATVLDWLRTELTDTPTAYNRLSDEDRNYVWYVYEMLTNQSVLNKESIDTSDEIYIDWVDGKSRTLEEFLKHAMRTRIIAHVVDMGASEERNPIEDYKIIRNEVIKYSEILKNKKEVVIASKMDLENGKENLEKFKKAYPDLEVIPVSSYDLSGIDEMMERLMEILDEPVESGCQHPGSGI